MNLFAILVVIAVLLVPLHTLVVELPRRRKQRCPVRFSILRGSPVRGMGILRDFHKRHPDALRQGREKAMREGVKFHYPLVERPLDDVFDDIRKCLGRLKEVRALVDKEGGHE